MIDLSFSRTLASDLAGFDSRVSDMEIGVVDGEAILFAASGSTAGISSYAISDDGLAHLADQQVWAAGADAFGEVQIHLADGAWGTRIVSALQGESGLQMQMVGDDATLTGRASWIDLDNADLTGAQSLEFHEDLLFVGRRSGGVGVCRTNTDGSVRNLRNAAVNLGYLIDLEIVDEHEDDFLIGASATENTIMSWRIGAGGELIEIGRIGMEEALGIATPSAMVAVTVNGIPYVVAAGSDSSSLSVIGVGSDGALSAVDHVIDDLNTRFQNVTELAAMEWGGHSFVAAAGADDGVSLFMVLPGGRLLEMDSLADGLESPLDNVSALAGMSVEDGLRLFAASGTEAGIAALEVDLSGFGTVETGSAANDLLGGGDRNDILVAGDGTDLLTGGGGQDIFVIDGGTGTDTVADYTPGVDVLDLSLQPMLYSMAQITVVESSTGATLYFNETEIELRSSSGEPLEAEDLTVKFGVAHLPTETIEMRDLTKGQILSGTEHRDVMEGGSRDDHLRGLDGNDMFYAGLGGDRYDGGDGVDTLSFARVDGRALVDLMLDVESAGFARFYDVGAASGDSYANIERFEGGDYADNLRGGDAGDVLGGGGVSDRLYGRGGDDTLNGGTGADALYGNRGADVMTGGDDEGRRDRFIYFNEAESGVGEGSRDIITDFVSGEDRIELGRLDADLTRGGNQAFTFIGASQFSGTAGELRVGAIAAEGVTVIQADLDGNGEPDFEIELTGLLPLNADDFLL